MAILALVAVIFLYYVGVGALTEGRKQSAKRQSDNEKLKSKVSELMAEDEELELAIKPKKFDR